MSVHGSPSPVQKGRAVEWTIRVEETRIGITDDRRYVLILTHVRARGTHADWVGAVTRTGGGGVIYRDTAPDAETLMLKCKDAIAHHDAVHERDPFLRNERDPVVDET